MWAEVSLFAGLKARFDVFFRHPETILRKAGREETRIVGVGDSVIRLLCAAQVGLQPGLSSCIPHFLVS